MGYELQRSGIRNACSSRTFLLVFILYYFQLKIVMRNFQDLLVWQKSHELTLKVYKISVTFPKEELFGLTSQIRRAASSIATNIAEGSGRNSDAEMKRFLIISTGSCSEVEYQLILSKDLGYISEALYKELSCEVVTLRKMLHTFINRLG
jgi:four helix bundle protein